MAVLSLNWGWVVLRGFVAILFGALTLFQPGITLAALVPLYGAYALVDGVFAIAWAFAHQRNEPYWPGLVIVGLLGIAAGLVTLFSPDITAPALLIVIAAWAIAAGVATVAVAFSLQRDITGDWRLVLTGLLAVALGVILVAVPGRGALAMVLWIGVYAIGTGVLLVTLGIELRSRCPRTHDSRLPSHPRQEVWQTTRGGGRHEQGGGHRLQRREAGV
jgi:uncharacterized membrane protein HdeD (DUF308 family)